MASDLELVMSNLAESVERLNSLTDTATSAVSELEEFLNQLNIGIESSIPLSSTKSLCFRRVGKDRSYRIAERDNFSGKLTPWSELSRDAKIEAVIALPKLVKSLATLVQERIESAEAALDELAEMFPQRHAH
jgi:hypothetical protein